MSGVSEPMSGLEGSFLMEEPRLGLFVE